MKKSIIFSTILVLLFTLIASAVLDLNLTNLDEVKTLPVSGTYNLDISGNMSLTCNATPQYNYSIMNISLYHDINGSWQENDSIIYTPSVGTSRQTSFLINDTPDGTEFKWGCQFWLNSTSIINNVSIDNSTVFVERIPSISVSFPADNAFSNSTSNIQRIEFTVSPATAGEGDSIYFCNILDNSSGTYKKEGIGYYLANSTKTNVTHEFKSDGSIIYNIECEEKFNGNVIGTLTANRTLNTDTVNPVITLDAPGSTVTSRIFFFNATATDSNLHTCNLYHNLTESNTSLWNSTNFNESITSMTSGTVFNFSQKTFSDDFDVTWNVWCNDSSGNGVFSSQSEVTIVTDLPGLTAVSNVSREDSCDTFNLSFTFNKEVNATIKYGLTSMSQTNTLTESDFATTQTFALDFGNNYETTHFVNVTICDAAENCNNSISEIEVISPIMICTGWSIWSVYDTAINMSDYFTASTAEFVYLWNISGQSWISYSASSTGQGNFNLGIGNAIYLYEGTNATYFRNNSGNPKYHLNITEGDNYFGLYNDYTFGNLTHNVFKNQTGGVVTPDSIYGAGGRTFNFTHFFSYNNSVQAWVGFTFSWSENNETKLGKSYKNGLDTLWAYSEFNVSINFTSDGYIFGNWT